MRKIILLEHVSLDGYVAGPNGEMDWITFDDDLQSYVHTLHETCDGMIWGRKTYDMMKGYWPTVLADPAADGFALNHAQWLQTATKAVFTNTVDATDWENTLLVHGDAAAEMAKLKQRPGKDFMMVGSISLAQTFMQHNLIDEYRLNVNPVARGGGRPLFPQQDNALKLKLVGSQTFDCGVVGLRYIPV